MKIIKHTYQYLTSSTYRFYCDFYDQQEVVDRIYRENLKMKEYESRKVFDRMYPLKVKEK